MFLWEKDFIQRTVRMSNKYTYILGFDVDDLILDLVSPWLKKNNKVFNDNVTKDMIKTWNIASYTNSKNTPQNFYNLLDGSLYDDIEPVDGALDGINRARKLGRVIFITSNFADIGRPKFDALNRLGFNVDKKDYFECSDKSLIRYDVLFDDNTDNVENAYQNSGVLFTQPWNRLYPYSPRVNNWNDINRFLERMLFV